MPSDFDQQSYWHARFASEISFEWLVPSDILLDLLRPFLASLSPHPPAPSTARILHLGPGTSDLHVRLRDAGFPNVTNLDYEPLAAERGRQLEEQAFGNVRACYVVGDATRLGEGDDGDAYGLVVDKSTADAVSCGGEEALLRMARGVHKCLRRDGGVWISLSYSAERFAIEGLPFAVEVLAKIPAPKQWPNDPDIYHWCYLLHPR